MTEQNTTTQMNVQDIIEMVIRRKALVLIPFIVVVIVSIVLYFILPKTYEAVSLVQVKNGKIVGSLASNQPDYQQPANIREEFDSLTKQVMAWPKLEQLVTQLHMVDDIKSAAGMEDFIRKLRDRVSVRQKSVDLMEIAYQDRSPVLAQQVANTLTQNFIDETARSGKEDARNAIDFIGDQLSIFRHKLDSSQQDVSVVKIETDLRAAMNRRMILKNRLESLQRIIPAQVTTEQNPVIGQMRTRLAQMEMELSRLMLDAKEGNPKVTELKDGIAALREKINEEMAKSDVKESISNFNPTFVQTEQELKQTDMEIEYLNKRKGDLTRYQDQIKRGEITEGQLSDLERNKRVDEDIYQVLLRQLEAAYVTERLQDSDKGSRFRVIEYARLPVKPVKPKKSKIIGGGAVAGLCLGFGLAFLVEQLTKSFQTPEQAKEVLKLPALGAISKIVSDTENKSTLQEMKEAFDRYIQKHQTLARLRFVPPHVAKKVVNSGVAPQIVIYHEPGSKVAEEYRITRTNIFHGLGTEHPLKTVLMTSTLHGEGKSTTSSNLSIALADSGKKILLIDCDLRKGVLHEMFALPRMPGLTDVMLKGADLFKTIQRAPVTGLSVLTSGTRPHKPSELLGSEKMKEILSQVEEHFDIVILDAPPVLSLPDAPILSKVANGVILVVQSGRTKQKDVFMTKNSLTQVNANIVGFILTNVQYYMPRYMYDYYYDYNYGTPDA